MGQCSSGTKLRTNEETTQENYTMGQCISGTEPNCKELTDTNEKKTQEYYTIKVKVQGVYRHVYLGTSSENQLLFYGPPTGEPDNRPRQNFSTLFQLTKSGDGEKISNFVTRKADLFARLTQSREHNVYKITLDESCYTEFVIGELEKDTTISGPTENGSTVVWYPTEPNEDPGKRKIKAKRVDDVNDEPELFLVTKV